MFCCHSGDEGRGVGDRMSYGRPTIVPERLPGSRWFFKPSISGPGTAQHGR